MKRLFPILLLSLIFSISVISQVRSQERMTTLQNRITRLVAKQDFNAVLPIAEDIARLEKKGGEKNLSNYAVALQNLARWRSARLDQALARTTSTVANIPKEAREIRELFGEVMALWRKTGDSPRLANALYESATFDSRLGEYSSEVAKLLRESLSVRESFLPADDDLVLLTAETLSGIYFAQGDFENFLPLNGRVIRAAENKFGQNDGRLTPALAMYADFLAMTDRDAEAAVVAQRVSAISGNTFDAAPNQVILKRGQSAIDLTFGTRPSGMLHANVIAVPDPSRITKSSTGFVSPVSGTPQMGPGDIRGLAVTDSGPDPRRANFSQIGVDIVVSETGSVLEVNPKTTDVKQAQMIRERVLTWKFKPFATGGTATRMKARFLVGYYK